MGVNECIVPLPSLSLCGSVEMNVHVFIFANSQLMYLWYVFYKTKLLIHVRVSIAETCDIKLIEFISSKSYSTIIVNDVSSCLCVVVAARVSVGAGDSLAGGARAGDAAPPAARHDAPAQHRDRLRHVSQPGARPS